MPYYVMDYYERGDLQSLMPELQTSTARQEEIFVSMCDCVEELHRNGHLHRDIKPANFLVDRSGNVRISDFGLSVDYSSGTRFTQSSKYWGTPGYMPPEFYAQGGFKNATKASDIFMLGKSFYYLLTGRDPTYLNDDGVPPALMHVFNRCCSQKVSERYQDTVELKQALSLAFDVLLERKGVLAKTRQLLAEIDDKLESDNRYSSTTVFEFLDLMHSLSEADQNRICFDLHKRFFFVIRNKQFFDRLPEFLNAYRRMVDAQNYTWSFAEIVSSNMRVIFFGEDVPNTIKARALDIAIDAAIYMNRFAAMDTCIEMITSIKDEQLAIEVSGIISKKAGTFVAAIETDRCSSEVIRATINAIAD